MKAIIRAAWRQKCQPEDNWALRRWERWFYVFKAIVCIMAHRHPVNYRLGNMVTVAVLGRYAFTHWEFGAMADIELLLVGQGVTRRWYVVIDWDTSA